MEMTAKPVIPVTESVTIYEPACSAHDRAKEITQYEHILTGSEFY